MDHTVATILATTLSKKKKNVFKDNEQLNWFFLLIVGWINQSILIVGKKQNLKNNFINKYKLINYFSINVDFWIWTYCNCDILLVLLLNKCLF